MLHLNVWGHSSAFEGAHTSICRVGGTQLQYIYFFVLYTDLGGRGYFHVTFNVDLVLSYWPRWISRYSKQERKRSLIFTSDTIKRKIFKLAQTITAQSLSCSKIWMRSLECHVGFYSVKYTQWAQVEWWLEHRHCWLVKRQWAGSAPWRVYRNEYQVLGSTFIPARLDTLICRESFPWFTTVSINRNTVIRLG